MNNNDILVYLDAGCSINKRGLARYLEYEELVNSNSSGILGMQLGENCLEKYYNTTQIFNYLNANEDIKNTPQIESGILVIRKCEGSMNIISKWLKAVYDNPLLFTDFYNSSDPSFVENRHDQSVLSVLMKQNNGVYIPDETWDPNNWENLSDKPFWATRIRT